MKSLIMIIGGGILQIPAIREAQHEGYHVLVTDISPYAPGCAIADYHEVVSTRDVEGSIACARRYDERHSLQAVFTAGTDVSYTVASVAHALNLVGIAPDAARRATDKYLMRAALSEHGVPCPRFARAHNCDEACLKATELGYPIVIKPVDNMGARGVRRIDNEHELCEQFPESIGLSGSVSERGVILEEYMDGAEISMDTIVDQEGTIHLLTVADRMIVFPPYFVEIGHTLPSRLSDATIAEAFVVMQQAVRAIGITIGAAKADIKITSTGPKIGEITARLSGGFHSQYTDPLATGMRTTKAALDLALGKPLNRTDITPRFHHVAIERALLPDVGIITAIKGINEARKIAGIFDIFLTKNVGDEVYPPTSNVGKVGHIIAHGETYHEAEEAYARARACIHVVTESVNAPV